MIPPLQLVIRCQAEFSKSPQLENGCHELSRISRITCRISSLMAHLYQGKGTASADLMFRIGNLTDNLESYVWMASRSPARDHPAVKAYQEYFSSIPAHLRGY